MESACHCCLHVDRAPHAAASAEEAARHGAGPIMPATITQIKRLSELRYSSKRHQLAFVGSASVTELGGASSIWLHDVSAAETRPLTSGNRIASHPRWCPAGDCITYLSEVDDAAQIRLLRMDGGEPETITSDANGVSTFEICNGVGHS